MKKIATLLLTVFIFISCDYFNVQEKENKPSEIIAIVNTNKLFKEDLIGVFPNNISKEDSIVMAKGFINDWAIKNLFLSKAEANISLDDVKGINELVKDYRESLLINSYKETLIKQRLDTVIGEVELGVFYDKNKDNFKLNEELVKIKYLHYDHNIINQKEFVKLFQSDKIEDLENLEKQQLSFKYYQFNDSIWTRIDNVLLKLPFSKENLLNKTKFLEKKDSLGVYLVAIKDVLVRNDTAPLNYMKPNMKQMILHQRKIQLIRDLEKILVKDATKNNNFKVY